MSDFWDEDKKDGRFQKRKIDIDGVRKIKKETPNRPEIKTTKTRPKRKLWPIFSLVIIIFIVATIISLGQTFAQAQKNKLSVGRLFQSGKYLVLLQNNAEMRPSGGFIGSFAIVEFSNFQIKNINFNSNIYKLDQAYVSLHSVPSPEPLSLMNNNHWALRDSNWDVSFPEAAKQIEWFYNQETGEEVDGIIAINGSVTQDLLRLTGPIKLAKYNTQITADNFFTELTTQIEQNYYDSSQNRDLNEPKSILKDLLPELISRLMQENKIELVKQIGTELAQKQILLFSKNQNIEQAILAENWGGMVRESASDYLYINNANVAGGKSSLNVKEKADYKVNESDEGLVGTLTITRSHAGTGVWPDGKNVNFTRVLVPYGSTLVSASLNGVDVSSKIATGQEANKTFFSYTTQTAPQTSDVLTLIYNLPISKRDYSLLWQKQSGNLGDEVSAKYQNRVLFDGILDTDKEVAVE